MRDLLLGWLHRQADGGIVCTACGLEYPRHKSPPLSEWRLLPDKRPLEGAPPWYDLPELFHACPCCGQSPCGSGMDWPHLIDGKRYPWMIQGGYVGLPEEASQDDGGRAVTRQAARQGALPASGRGAVRFFSAGGDLVRGDPRLSFTPTKTRTSSSFTASSPASDRPWLNIVARCRISLLRPRITRNSPRNG
jgi:hypothetical protein